MELLQASMELAEASMEVVKVAHIYDRLTRSSAQTLFSVGVHGNFH